MGSRNTERGAKRKRKLNITDIVRHKYFVWDILSCHILFFLLHISLIYTFLDSWITHINFKPNHFIDSHLIEDWSISSFPEKSRAFFGWSLCLLSKLLLQSKTISPYSSYYLFQKDNSTSLSKSTKWAIIFIWTLSLEYSFFIFLLNKS